MKKRFRVWNLVSRFLLGFVIVCGFWVQPVKVVRAQTATCSAEFQPVAVPLTELGSDFYNRVEGDGMGYSGGLYPEGNNYPPEEHLSAGLVFARQIQPLDGVGNYDPEQGKIVMVSIGMSNTNYEFDAFTKILSGDEALNPRLVLINGALPNQTADRWVDPDAITWQELRNTLDRNQVSAAQVQTAWIKLTLTGGGDFPEKAQTLQSNLETIVQNLKTAYPNVKLVYLSSRIYSYTYDHGLSPEPLAYETGFAVKWLIEDQISGKESLNFDETRGDVRAPLLLWGPYLWADGQNPRADGLVWLQEDLTDDCTHPSRSGVEKVAGLLIDFFKTDLTSTPWFLDQAGMETHTLFLPLVTGTPEPEETPQPSNTPSPLPQIVPTMLVDKEGIGINPGEKNLQPSLWQRFLTWIRSLLGLRQD